MNLNYDPYLTSKVWINFRVYLVNYFSILKSWMMKKQKLWIKWLF